MLVTARSAHDSLGANELPELFKIVTQREIWLTLRELVVVDGSTALASSPEHNDSIPVTKLSLESDHIALRFNDERDASAAAASDCARYLIADRDRIRVVAPLGGLFPIDSRDPCTIRAVLPSTLYRIQRREGYRIRPTANEALVCRLPGRAQRSITCAIHNLSVIGVAIFLPADMPSPTVGTEIRHAQIVDGDDVPIPVTLRVRREWPQQLADRIQTVLGCQFEHLDSLAERRLQLLITRIEQDRRHLTTPTYS